MDKTDKILKQFGKETTMNVVPIGDDVIIPNLSGIKGNKDAMNKLTLQTVTDNGNTTSKEINVNNGTVNMRIGFASGTVAYLGTSTDHNVVFKSNGTSVGSFNSFGQFAIGSSSSDTKAILTLVSTSRGFLPPKMTTAQKNAITSPTEGLQVYDTDLHKMCVYTGAAWETITSA